VVRTDGVVIDGVTITSDGSTGQAIYAKGSPSKPIRNLTIRNCTIKGFSIGILAEHVENLVIDHCTIEDADYAGIAIYSGVGGRITNNAIRRIGTTRTDLTVEFVENNAYGITLDRSPTDDLERDPRSSDFLIDGNLVEDVPLWMCLNTHAGERLVFSNNTTRRCPRAIFIAGDSTENSHAPIDITITNNRLEEAVTKKGGTDDVEGILISELQGGTITGNLVSRSYGTSNVNDYLGRSVGVTISGQQDIP
jgi:hypothetical protein